MATTTKTRLPAPPNPNNLQSPEGWLSYADDLCITTKRRCSAGQDVREDLLRLAAVLRSIAPDGRYKWHDGVLLASPETLCDRLDMVSQACLDALQHLALGTIREFNLVEIRRFVRRACRIACNLVELDFDEEPPASLPRARLDATWRKCMRQGQAR